MRTALLLLLCLGWLSLNAGCALILLPAALGAGVGAGVSTKAVLDKVQTKEGSGTPAHSVSHEEPPRAPTRP